jgi:prepilin-type processing-associated H-X9-DG protein
MAALGVARSVACKNNLKHIVRAEMERAAANGGRGTPALKDDVYWSRQLLGGTTSRGKDLGAGFIDGEATVWKNAIFYCPSASRDKTDFAGSHTYGKNEDTGNASMFSLSANTLIFADTIIDGDKNWQGYKFNPGKLITIGSGKAGLHLRHNNSLNAAFADGRVETIRRGDFAKYGIKVAFDENLKEVKP